MPWPTVHSIQFGADATGIPGFLVGHVGGGNFHFGYLIDSSDAEERKRAEGLDQALVARVIALAGTCTGEHGVGLHKIGFLIEAGAGAMDMMHSINPMDGVRPTSFSLQRFQH